MFVRGRGMGGGGKREGSFRKLRGNNNEEEKRALLLPPSSTARVVERHFARVRTRDLFLIIIIIFKKQFGFLLCTAMSGFVCLLGSWMGPNGS